MIWIKVAGELVSWSSWLIQHQDHFTAILDKVGGIGNFAEKALADPKASLRRFGNTLVFGREDGGQAVLGFIEQTGPQLNAIEQAVNGIHVGQHTIAATLASLQAISMVSLGIVAITPLVLTAQLVALGTRLKKIGRTVSDIKDMIETRNEAQLKTGLDHLNEGQRLLRQGKSASDRLGDGLHNCKEAMFFFEGLLARELNAKSPRREAVGFLTRQCAVALGGTIACHGALGEDHFAIEKVETLAPRLREGAKWIFTNTIGTGPERFLEPQLSQHGVDLTFLTKLFNDASQVWGHDRPRYFTEAALFEDLRPGIRNIGRGSFQMPRSYIAGLIRDLQEAASSIEETSRVLSLKTTIQEVNASGRKMFDVMEEVRARAETEDPKECQHVVWAANAASGICAPSAH